MLSRESIDHLADLARIDVSDSEKGALLGELESILSYVSEIQSLASDKKAEHDLVNVNLREDEHPNETGAKEELIRPFADKEKDYLKVKKVIASS